MFKQIFSVIALLLLMTPAFAETVRFSKGNTFSSLTTTGNTQIGDSSDDLLTIYSSSITLINGTTIWTNVPPLNIFGNMSLTDANQLSWGGANNFISGSNSSNFVRVISNNAERMRFGLFGTGIGTTQPVLPFEVAGGVLFSGSSFTVTSNNINLGNVSQAGVLGSTYTAASATWDIGSLVTASSGSFTTTGTNDANVGLRVSSTAVIGLSGGSLLVGTTNTITMTTLRGVTPTLTLEDSVVAVANGGTYSNIDFYTNDTSEIGVQARIRAKSEEGSAGGSGELSFWTAASGANLTEKMRIQANGNIGIASTTPLGQFVVGPGAQPSIFVRGTGGNSLVGIRTSNPGSVLHIADSAGTAGSYLRVSTGTTTLFEVNGSSLVVGAINSNFNSSVGITSSTPSGLFTVGSSSGIVMNQSGHFEVFSSTNPTMLNCGTSPSFLPGSTDMNGKFQVGTGGSESVCNVTFSNSWTQAPSCWCANESQSQLVRSSSTATTLTCSLGVAFTAGDTINYGCLGRR